MNTDGKRYIRTPPGLNNSKIMISGSNQLSVKACKGCAPTGPTSVTPAEHWQSKNQQPTARLTGEHWQKHALRFFQSNCGKH